MANVLPLEALGPRICIFGPSNAGKSTLAQRLGERLDAPSVHLDQLHHQPNTDWVPRPREEFVRLHAEAIAEQKWIMEGNYMGLFHERVERATGIIMLGSGRLTALARYLRRTMLQRERAGMLEGGSDRINFDMIRFILIEQPPKRQRDLALVRSTGLPLVVLNSMSELKAAYRSWHLQ